MTRCASSKSGTPEWWCSREKGHDGPCAAWHRHTEPGSVVDYFSADTMEKSWDDAMNLIRESGEDPDEVMAAAIRNVDRLRIEPLPVFGFWRLLWVTLIGEAG